MADVPAPVVDVQGDRRWMDIHEEYVREAKTKEPVVLFIGDSLIQNLMQCVVWEELFEPMHCSNFGLKGDTTCNILWRLQNGELDELNPTVVVVLAGTNNHEHTAEQVVVGIEAIVKLVNSKIPSAHIFCLAIPPRGHKPNPLREKIKKINDSLADVIPKIPNSEFFDPKAKLIQSDGTIDREDLFDFLHFTARGYRKYCQPLATKIEELLPVGD